MAESCGGLGLPPSCSSMNSPLQQSAAGCVPALRGARRHHPDRRHHGESSFEVISALLSRSRVYALRLLSVPELTTLLRRALPVVHRKRPRSARTDRIYSNGERGRRTNTLEAAAAPRRVCSRNRARNASSAKCALRQRRRGALQPDFALHKSVRSSDVDAALYWLARCSNPARTVSISPPPDPHVDRRHRPGRSARSNRPSQPCRRSIFSGFRKATSRWPVSPSTLRRPRAMHRIKRWARWPPTSRNDCRASSMNLRKRPHQAHESLGLREGLRARPQIRRRHHRHGMLPHR